MREPVFVVKLSEFSSYWQEQKKQRLSTKSVTTLFIIPFAAWEVDIERLYHAPRVYNQSDHFQAADVGCVSLFTPHFRLSKILGNSANCHHLSLGSGWPATQGNLHLLSIQSVVMYC